MKRLCVFAHYDKNSLVDEYVVYYIKALKEVCDEIIFASPSNIPEDEQKKLFPYIKHFISRENEGYDFGSWKSCLEYIGYENLQDYDEVVFANDSCYGPLYSFKEIFAKMDSRKDLDAWCITDSNSVSYHMQSYFFVIRKPILKNINFINFWKNITSQPTKHLYIIKYEVGLSKLIVNLGYNFGVYCTIPYFIKWLFGKFIILRYIYLSKTSSKFRSWIKAFKKAEYHKERALYHLINKLRTAVFVTNNNSLFNVNYILKNYHLPIVKVMLFRNNPYEENINKIEKFIKEKTNYPFSLIKQHLER